MVRPVDGETLEAAIRLARDRFLPAPALCHEPASSQVASYTQTLLNRAANRLAEQTGCTLDEAMRRIYQEARSKQTLLSTAAWTVLARVEAAKYGRWMERSEFRCRLPI